MKTYNVIWFDDEHDTLEIIKEKASINGIHLVGFGNSFDGISELEKNYSIYDAVIVDGLFFNKAGQKGDSVSDKALVEVFRKLDNLQDKKIMPSFILSGQKSFTKQVNPHADVYKNNKVYDKQTEKDLDNLWIDLKKAADQQIETQLRHIHHRAFNVCQDKYIGNAAAVDLLSILKNENDLSSFRHSELFFTALRKIIEDVFIACNKFGLLPDVFVKPSVALNESSKFLSGGIEKGYQLDVPVFPKIISEHVRSILAVCQPAAHRSEIDNFISLVDSPYLLLSVTYQLLDVLLWFKNYADNHNNVELNKANFKPVADETNSSLFTGIVEQDDNRNYHCGNIILTYKHINDMGYKKGDKIRIIKSANNTNDKTMHIYSKSALQTEKL